MANLKVAASSRRQLSGQQALAGWKRLSGLKTLSGLIIVVLALHFLVIVCIPHAVAFSRVLTGLAPLCAAACALWRAAQLPSRERTSWWWVSASLLLWSSAQLVEVCIGTSPEASSLLIDKSDLLYLITAFPLLLAFSNTCETEPIRGIFSLNLSQAALATGLVYVRVFRTPMPANMAQTILLRIYAAECILLVIAATVRLVSWATLEERRRMRLVCTCLWIYLPIELGLDYATEHWHLKQGTLLDLLWSVPFILAGWQALHMPMRETSAFARLKRQAAGKQSLLLQSLCPLLITLGVFALAVSIARLHPMIATVSVLLLFIVQGLLSGAIQVNYLQEHAQSVRQERELKAANAVLEQLSFLDPLTGIANRRQFNESLEAEWKRGARRQEQVALLMIDVDCFKGVNDIHGHAYGDECLFIIGQTLHKTMMRATDLVARYGGEEFIVLLGDTDLSHAFMVAERLQGAVNQLDIINEASPFGQRLTVSVGVAAMQPNLLTTGASLIEQADQALYLAKRRGRNRIQEYEYSLASSPSRTPGSAAGSSMALRR